LTYNPSKFSMDNAWTSKPTCAYMYDHGNSHFKQTSYVTMKNPIGRLQLTTSHWTCTNIQSNHV
jgi:arylamine N-acetyltransferase